MTYDLVIRNGNLVDGTGAPSRRADIGISQGVIAEIGSIPERGVQEIDAEGHVVTPGFVDGHTHMDAQLHWDPLGTSSCWHGVTTAVMGNCGFTLAPVRSGNQGLVVRNLERAEDISPTAMAAGIDWCWETFPEYLDVVDSLPKGINYAVNIGHSALRTWAMGARAFEEAATEDDLELMAGQLRAALRAGAIGFTTSRSDAHETADDRPVASRIADWTEISRLVGVLSEEKRGVFEIASETAGLSADPEVRADFSNRLQALAVETGVPTFIGVVPGVIPMETCRDNFSMIDAVHSAEGAMYALTHSRGVTSLVSFSSHLPFDQLPHWRELRQQPLDEQKRLLRDPGLRSLLVTAARDGVYGRSVGPVARKPEWDKFYVYDRPLPPYPLLADLAKERGKDPVEMLIDLSLETNFGQFFLQYLLEQPSDADLLEMMRHPHGVMTFSDAGAHVTQICDAMISTYLLAYWVRERGEFTLEEGVHMVTKAPAMAWGITDRGTLAPGMAADINVIDFDNLMPGLPEAVHDLPGGAQRLISKSKGIFATIVAGEMVLQNGRHTGALPGRLLRNASAGR